MLIGPSCHEGGVRGRGDATHGVMMLGIAPGKNELATGIPFTGSSGALMDNILEATGWNRDKTYCTNLLCYENQEPTFEEVLECRPRLLAEIENVKPKLVVTLGKFASELFFPTRKFGDIRGMIDWYAPWNCHILPTYHPAAILYGKMAGPGIASDIVFDFKKIPMFLTDLELGVTSRTSRVMYDVVSSREQAQHLLDLLPKDRIVTIDIETTSKDQDILDAHSDKLLCLAISVQGGTKTWVFPTEWCRELKWPQGVQWTGHYMTFDAQGILAILGVDIPIVHDTLLMHYMLDERAGRFGRHGLKPLSRAYAYSGFYEESVAGARKKNTMATVPTQITYAYNADDAANTLFLAERFLPWVKQEGMLPVYERTIKFANCAKYMQYRGIAVDRQRLADLAVEWIPLMIEKEESLRNTVDDFGGNRELNFDSDVQLGEFLFGTLRLPCTVRTAKTGRPSVAKEVLELLADEHPFVNDLVDLAHLKHLFSTYILGVRDDIKKTNRVHPMPILHGTVSGRLAYSNPPINTIPRPESESLYGPKLRGLFVAAEDHVILSFDYKQAEVYMAAAYSNDLQMLDDLRSGDIHTRNAAWIYNITEPQVVYHQRYEAKRTTFGKIYLIGVPKLAKQTKKTPEVAAEFSRLWDKRYATYIKYTQQLFLNARQTGEVRTKTGRVRRFPIILDSGVKSQIVNFPLQATSHDYVMETINRVYWPIRESWNAHVLLDVHDALLVEAHKSNWREVAKYVYDVMTTQFWPDLPIIPVEIKVGPSWGEVEEISL